LLNGHGKLEDWYTFENSSMERVLRQWAEDEGFTVVPVIVREAPIRVYQFKVALKGISPQIWRRIQVPENYSFWDLHVAIQDAMGWFDYHLHSFRVIGKESGNKTEIGIPEEEISSTAPETIPGWEAAIIDHFPEVGVTADYEYDFGDGWVHEVVLEGIFLSDQEMQYPLCIGGERACPVEDCGGVHGYDRLLCALSSPENEEYEELLIWLGKKFDPDEFAQDTVVFDDPKARWEKAFQNN